MQTTRYPSENRTYLLSQVDSRMHRERRSRTAVILSVLKGVFTREKRWGVSHLLPGALGILIILTLSLSGAVFGQSPICSVPDLAPGSDRGSSSSDNVTNDRTPTFTGTAEVNSTVEVRSDLAGSLGTAVAGGVGDWTFAVPSGRALVDGTHTISARATPTPSGWPP